MDPLSYLAQTEQQLSFIIAREGRQGGAERERADSPVGLIKNKTLEEEEEEEGDKMRRRVSGIVKVLIDRDTAAILSGLIQPDSQDRMICDAKV